MNHWYLGGSWRINVGFLLSRSEVARHNKPHDCWIAINKVLVEGEVLPTTPIHPLNLSWTQIMAAYGCGFLLYRFISLFLSICWVFFVFPSFYSANYW